MGVRVRVRVCVRERGGGVEFGRDSWVRGVHDEVGACLCGVVWCAVVWCSMWSVVWYVEYGVVRCGMWSVVW